MLVEGSGETSDRCVSDKLQPRRFRQACLLDEEEGEVAGGRKKKTREKISVCGYEEISLAHNLCKRQATPGMTALSFRGEGDLI